MNSYAPHDIISIKSNLIIRDLLKKGYKKYTRFGIFFLGKDQSENASYAVLIKKNVGNAVKRNYYKRIIREYIRKNISRFGHYNMIIFLFNSADHATYIDIKSEFDQKLVF